MLSFILDSYFILMIQVGDLLGTLIKLFKVSFLPFFEDLSPHLNPMLVSLLPLNSFTII